MDNITHTLVGVALGHAGLKRRTPLALTTLIIGANLPDVDGITYFTGGALAFRRGWTHGILAMVVLPFLLTGAVVLGDRVLRRRARPDLEPARPREVLLLAFAAILLHPFLDFLNTYGVRFLMPFRNTWFYGDAWNIADLWVWLALGMGVGLSSWLDRHGRPPRTADRPALGALALAGAYAAFMLATSTLGRHAITRDLTAMGHPPEEVMVAPTAWNPLVRGVVVQEGDRYRFGRLSVVPWRVGWSDRALPVGLGDPRARTAATTPEGLAFLGWARFPFALVESAPGGVRVVLADARYGPQGWARVVIPLVGGAIAR